MDEFFGLLPFFLIVLLSTLSGGKKGKKAQQRENNRAPRQARRGERRAQQERPVFFEEADEAYEAGCLEQRIHVHDVSQTMMQAAGEGEDPCHAGAAPEAAAFDEETENALAQDVLRGVIMSEILTRPCERAARHRGRIHG